MVPDALERSPIEVAATMEGALDWLRSYGPSKNFRFDYPSQASTRRTAATGAGLLSTALAQAGQMEQALTWLKQNDTYDTSRMYDAPSIVPFRSLGTNGLGGIPEHSKLMI
jgi:hypothetical protein